MGFFFQSPSHLPFLHVLACAFADEKVHGNEKNAIEHAKAKRREEVKKAEEKEAKKQKKKDAKEQLQAAREAKLAKDKAEALAKAAAAKKWKNPDAVLAYAALLQSLLDEYKAGATAKPPVDEAKRLSDTGCIGGPAKPGWIENAKKLNAACPGHDFTSTNLCDKVRYYGGFVRIVA